MIDLGLQISLKAARVNAELTQEKAAEKLGISINTYIAWEKDPGRVPARAQKAISEIFGIEIDSINFLR